MGLPMKEARGVYQVRLGSDARVTDGGTKMDVPESVYRARGYQPDFNSSQLNALSSEVAGRADEPSWRGDGGGHCSSLWAR